VTGARSATDDGSDCGVVGVNHLFARQADMAPLASLVPEQIAEWGDGKWQIKRFDEEAPDWSAAMD